MLSIHLLLGLPSGLFPSGFPTNKLYTFLFVADHCYSENLVALLIEPGASGSVARSSDHLTAAAVIMLMHSAEFFYPHSFLLVLGLSPSTLFLSYCYR
jgi:hypothetical protein